MNLKDLLDFLDFARQMRAIFEDYPIAAALVLLGLGFWGLVDAHEIRALNVQSQQLNTDINMIRMQLAVRHERLQSAQQREETLTKQWNRRGQSLSACTSRLQAALIQC
jgi:hypothetical protein